MMHRRGKRIRIPHTLIPLPPAHTCAHTPHIHSCHQDKISYYLMCSGFMPDKAKELQVGGGIGSGRGAGRAHLQGIKAKELQVGDGTRGVGA